MAQQAVLVDRLQADSLATRAYIRAALKRIAAERVGPDIALRSPSHWLTEVLGVRRVYPKQVEMFEAVRDHPQVSVVGCNSSGKDFAAARLALWWMYTHDDAKVVIAGPSSRQVQIVWSEVRDAYFNSKAGLGGQAYEIPLLRWTDRRYIIGFSTDKPHKILGHHSEHLLVIITEAHGVRQQHIDSLNKLNPTRLLMTGNPISESGEFYDSHHSKAHLWQTISINAFETPNLIEGYLVIPGLITTADIARHKANWGEDSPLYRMTVLNEWCEGMGKLVVVPLSWALEAERAEHMPGGIEVVSCDPARYGQDYTEIWSRRGRVCRRIWRKQGASLMETAGVIKEYRDRHRLAHIVVDGTGVGSGIVDRLRELGIGVLDFQGGSSASSSNRFVNRIAECWWRMREAYAAGLDTPEDPLLRSQACSRKYEIKSDKRIQLESKERMREEGRQSPDAADALAMTFVLDWEIGKTHLSPDSNIVDDDAEVPEQAAHEADAKALEGGRRPGEPNGKRNGHKEEEEAEIYTPFGSGGSRWDKIRRR